MLVSPKWEDEKYKYAGESLEQGQCGIIKRRVSSINHGKVKCFMGIERRELVGEIELIVARKLDNDKFEKITKKN